MQSLVEKKIVDDKDVAPKTAVKSEKKADSDSKKEAK